MRTALLPVLVAAAGVGATLASCGTSSRCTPSSCSTGCCDLSGVCQSGSTTGACGRGGAACSTCSLGASCSFGTCVSGSGAGTSGTGGGSSGTGGGTAGAGGGTAGSGGGTSGGSSGGTTGGGSAGGSVGGGATAGGTGGGTPSCADGCIDGFGACRRLGTPAQSANLCGINAQPCEPCFGATPVCNAGVCVSGAGGGAAGGLPMGGGSATGGGSGTGGGASATCDLVSAPSCPSGSQCVINGTTSTAGTCIPGDCNLITQDCPTGKCVLGATADGGVRRVCSTGGGTLTPGTSCVAAATDPCVTGAQCLGAAGSSTCRQYCTPTTPCPSGSVCSTLFQFGPAPGGERHLVCTPLVTCNPFTQAPCASNETCVIYATNSPPGCMPAGTATSGASCSGINACVRGLQCVGSSPPGICRPFCNLAGSPSCTSGTCTALPGQTMYGTCM